MSIDFETWPIDTVLAAFFAEARTENGALFVIVKCNKTITALLLVEYENLWSPKNNIDLGLRPRSILFFGLHKFSYQTNNSAIIVYCL